MARVLGQVVIVVIQDDNGQVMADVDSTSTALDLAAIGEQREAGAAVLLALAGGIQAAALGEWAQGKPVTVSPITAPTIPA